MIPAAHILEVVARHRRVSVSMMREQSRTRRFAWPRQEACYFLRGRTELSLAAIGRIMGHRDHSTVVYAVEAVEKRIAEVPAYAEQIDFMSSLLDTWSQATPGQPVEMVVDIARRIISSPESATTVDALCLSSTLLGALAVLAGNELTDREARASAHHQICGTGGINRG